MYVLTRPTVTCTLATVQTILLFPLVLLRAAIDTLACFSLEQLGSLPD
jgi:hypothetical protein